MTVSTVGSIFQFMFLFFEYSETAGVCVSALSALDKWRNTRGLKRNFVACPSLGLAKVATGKSVSCPFTPLSNGVSGLSTPMSNGRSGLSTPSVLHVSDQVLLQSPDSSPFGSLGRSPTVSCIELGGLSGAADDALVSSPSLTNRLALFTAARKRIRKSVG